MLLADRRIDIININADPLVVLNYLCHQNDVPTAAFRIATANQNIV